MSGLGVISIRILCNLYRAQRAILYIKHSLCPRLQTHSHKKKITFSISFKIYAFQTWLKSLEGYFAGAIIRAEQQATHNRIAIVVAHYMRCVHTRELYVLCTAVVVTTVRYGFGRILYDVYFSNSIRKSKHSADINSAISLNTLLK